MKPHTKTNIILTISIILISILLLWSWFLLPQTSFITQNTTIMNALFIVTAFLMAFLISKIACIYVDKFVEFIHGKGRSPKLLGKAITVIIWLIMSIIILKHFNIEISPFITALGIGGLAVGLALQPTLTNFFAGIQILSHNPIRVGDYVEVGGFEGKVEDIGWRATQITTLLNNVVIIPNSKLMASTLINDSMPLHEMSVKVMAGVDYGSDLEKVEKITLEVAREIQKKVPGAITTFDPKFRFYEFGDSNIKLKVILRVKDFESKYAVIHQFIKDLKKRYEKEGIEISWPIRKITNMK
jgi:small-conductance mechanosensitive channel